MDLNSKFENAVTESKQLIAKPDNDTLLKLYSLYKQATTGDINIDAPNMFDFVGKAKYDAWMQLKGVGTEEAMERYIAVVEGLKQAT